MLKRTKYSDSILDLENKDNLKERNYEMINITWPIQSSANFGTFLHGALNFGLNNRLTNLEEH